MLGGTGPFIFSSLKFRLVSLLLKWATIGSEQIRVNLTQFIDSIWSHWSHLNLEIQDDLWFNNCWDFVVNYWGFSSITTLERNKARDSRDILYGIRNTLPTFRLRVQFPSPAPKIEPLTFLGYSTGYSSDTERKNSGLLKNCRNRFNLFKKDFKRC